MMVTEKRFEYKGFPCVVLFMPGGYRCGYVGISKGNPWYKSKRDTEKISCHGGITYQDSCLHGQEYENVWWIGFDCGHCFDGADAEKAKELYKDDKNVLKQIEIMDQIGWFEILKEFPVRSLEYCEGQCKGIVDQILGGKND